MEVASIVYQQLSNCLEHLDAIQSSSFSVEPSSDSNKLLVYIYGEDNTIHKGGIYKSEFTFTKEYPSVRPEGKFIAPLPYHCNVRDNGDICLDYYNNWNSNTYQTKNFVTLVESLCYFIHNQNKEHPWRKDIANEEKDNYNLYVQNVKNKALECREAFIEG
ncbi:hypothetical protein ABPG72_002724 [Tetrahymena utriculariae]